jgi:hypothetical protein
MMAVALRKHVTGSNGDSGDVAMEGKMAGVVAGYEGWIRGGRKKRVGS